MSSRGFILFPRNGSLTQRGHLKRGGEIIFVLGTGGELAINVSDNIFNFFTNTVFDDKKNGTLDLKHKTVH